MIQPLEWKEARPIHLPGDAVATTDDAWSMFRAERDGDLERVKALASQFPGLARYEYNYTPPIHFAVREGHIELVRYLLEQGTDPTYRTYPFQEGGHLLIVNARLVAGALIAQGARYTIFIAAVLGDDQFVRDALSRDSTLANVEDTCHQRPISAAARRNDLAMVKLLLAHGADPNLPEEGAHRGHALWIAVFQRQPEMVRLLVDHGADPNAMVESSGTPIGHARKDPELFRLLLEHGGDPKPGDRDQLERLISDGELAGVEQLLKQRAELARSDAAFWGEGIAEASRRAEASVR